MGSSDPTEASTWEERWTVPFLFPLMGKRLSEPFFELWVMDSNPLGKLLEVSYALVHCEPFLLCRSPLAG
ncbi:hypothetical protein HYQ46_006701 [Verticillium longisporum]|nr:hypothetical protein HYQ46_006701 [Verticillium longisporum]